MLLDLEKMDVAITIFRVSRRYCTKRAFHSSTFLLLLLLLLCKYSTVGMGFTNYVDDCIFPFQLCGTGRTID